MDEKGCNPEMMRDHEKRITAVEESSKSSHHRIDNFERFGDEMRNITTAILETNGDIKLIFQEIKTITQTLVRHDKELDSIQDKMETKEGMTVIHESLHALSKDLNSLDDRFTKEIKKLDNRITMEENKEAKNALKDIKMMRNWLIGSVGAIILALVMMYLGLN